MANKNRMARMRVRDWLPEFDFLGTFIAFFFGLGWTIDRPEPKPIPVRARRR
ncbi:MAG: hypothetical protein ACREEP_02180 [Dongiaceae bacterium]